MNDPHTNAPRARHDRPTTRRALGAALGAALATTALPAQAGDDLSGRWVMVQLTTTVATVPVVGEIRARTALVAIHDLVQSGDRLRGKGRLCKLDLDSGTTMVSTTLPDAFKRSLPAPYIDAVVRAGDDGVLRFAQPRQTLVVGALLESPGDALPTGLGDGRLHDQDRDGKPGVTVRVSGLVEGELYVAQRTWTELAGARQDDGSFAGRVAFDNEQVLLDTDNEWLRSTPAQRSDASASWFRLVRVADGAKCGTARRVAAAWLP
ncbi:MAG: hypothetical protein IT373_10050 [Polyangiaceae bacterium]|nr:hypothetical protein [Polyangiaceae bacterium]